MKCSMIVVFALFTIVHGFTKEFDFSRFAGLDRIPAKVVKYAQKHLPENVEIPHPKKAGETIKLLQLFGGDDCDEYDDGNNNQVEVDNGADEEVSAACRAAQNELERTMGGIMPEEGQEFDPSEQDLDRFCSDQNQNDLMAAFEDMGDACSDPNDQNDQNDEEEATTLLSAIFGMLCIQADGEYCFPVFMELSGDDDCGDGAQEERSMEENMALFCDEPCFVEILSLFSGEEQCGFESVFSMIELACLEVNGVFCFEIFQAMEEETGDPSETMSLLCESGCAERLFAELEDLQMMEDNMDCDDDYDDDYDMNDEYADMDGDDGDSDSFPDFSQICFADYSSGEPEYCILTISEVFEEEEDETMNPCIFIDEMDPQYWTCSMECKEYLQDVIDFLGCCAPWMLNFLDEAGSDSMGGFITNTCELPLPFECVQPSNSNFEWQMEFSVPVPNLDCDFAQSETDANGDGNADEDSDLLESVLRDIGAHLGVSHDRFENVQVDCDGEGTVFSMELTAFSAEEADRISDAAELIQDLHLAALTQFLSGDENADAYVDENNSDFHATDASVEVERITIAEEYELDTDSRACSLFAGGVLASGFAAFL